MFTKWLRNYLSERVKIYGSIEATNYLSHGLPKHWAIRHNELVDLDSK